MYLFLKFVIKILLVVSSALALYFIALSNGNFQSIFKGSILIIAILSLIIFLLITLVKKDSFEIAFYKTIALSEFLFIVATYGPIFIDRSISYHIVLAAYDNGYVTSKQLQKNTFDIYHKRLIELSELGLLYCNENNCKLTNSGIYFSKVTKQLSRLTNIDREYQKFLFEVRRE